MISTLLPVRLKMLGRHAAVLESRPRALISIDPHVWSGKRVRLLPARELCRNRRRLEGAPGPQFGIESSIMVRVVPDPDDRRVCLQWCNVIVRVPIPRHVPHHTVMVCMQGRRSGVSQSRIVVVHQHWLDRHWLDWRWLVERGSRRRVENFVPGQMLARRSTIQVVRDRQAR